MFEYDLTHWTTFLGAAVLLNITPGPDMAFILGHTAKGGMRAGLAAMFGVWAGAFGHVLFAALGLTAMVAATSHAFAVIKWLGVVYLLWIGVQSLLSRGGTLDADEPRERKGMWAIFRQGMFIDLLNPKVALFFLAFLPQFVWEGAGPIWAQFLLHGTLIIVVAAAIEPPLIFFGDRLTSRMRASRTISMWLDRAFGCFLIWLGFKLATVER